MEHTKIIVAAVILLVVVGGMFTFTYLKKQELEQAVPTEQTPIAEEGPYAYVTRIDGKHFFDGKTHTIVGEIPMPTPCDLLNWDTQIQESMPETAVIGFTVLNNADACAQVVTLQRFKVSFDASQNAAIRATFEGRAVELNLVPAGVDETPEDFELFIKG